MSFCEQCSIEEKLMQCCGRLPMAGTRAPLLLQSGATVSACPHLSAGGLCTVYESRPQGCRDFFCDAFMTDLRSGFARRDP
ncbi:MAG TPA: hypothetical protein PKN50_09125 [Spirochaetota bacterium]|nr:hypothetical protein [Spirochaetota bacterium]HPV43298.1 hypothetical protein [Spirochaetota bacterium]